ncbi:MAG: 4a-hydroxytetrahydrobiopterin dehydratase [Candidatus Microthrix sp.]|nr:4a-hydroxytetrahydrobiopterin dehydratase [Candidatus Microthrix sp.]
MRTMMITEEEATTMTEPSNAESDDQPQNEGLTDDEVRAALRRLPGWQLHDGALRRRFEFADFAEAFAFMSRVAPLAEAANHHPDWSNSYNVVTVDLISHDAGTLTMRDTDLAAAIQRVA